MAGKCTYSERYFNHELNRDDVYRCGEDEFSGGLCRFHHKGYAQVFREELIESLINKVELANQSRLPLQWIGYQIPDISLNHYHSIADFMISIIAYNMPNNNNGGNTWSSTIRGRAVK